MDAPTARHLAGILVDETDATDNSAGVAPPGFEIFHQIGEGASGRVWLAQRDGSDNPVALKIMKTPLGEGKSAQRAWRELDLLNQIRSKRIPAVLDHGTHRGRLFIATEFIDGLAIDQHIESASPDTRARVELLAKVCEAAGELHNHGVIHRDLKPSNILVTPAGEPVIIDLGIAGLLTSSVMQTLTADGTPIGTPAYMAPEQARGERDAVGVRSDVWALGAVCCRVLTGEPPHDLDDMSLYEAVRRVGALPAREPAELDGSLPRPLGAVVSKACSMTAGDRYASATELAADLRRWLNKQPVEAQPPGPWVKAMRWTTRHPVLTSAGVCAAMVAATGAATWWTSHKLNWEPFDVAVNSEKTEAWLESRTQNPLATLVSCRDTRASISFAERIDMPPRAGGGWIAAVVAPITVSGNHSLSLYDPRQPGTPMWTAPRPGEFPPLEFPSYDSDQARAAHVYAARRPIVADIFPDHPGEEIAFISLGSPDFPSCLRVFGVDREELFRVWIPGHATTHWVDGEGVFVVAGPSHRMPTPAWSESDARVSDRPPMFAAGVMLIRPELGRLDDKWLTYKVPGSQTNVDKCWVLVQPVTHEADAWEADHSLGGFDLAVSVASRGHDIRHSFTLDFRAWRNESFAQAGGTWITNSRLEELGPLEGGNSLMADAGFAELIGLFGTPRFRFEDAPAFDPNRR